MSCFGCLVYSFFVARLSKHQPEASQLREEIPSVEENPGILGASHKYHPIFLSNQGSSPLSYVSRIGSYLGVIDSARDLVELESNLESYHRRHGR